eukprot:573249-Amphidinium_carterae.1
MEEVKHPAPVTSTSLVKAKKTVTHDAVLKLLKKLNPAKVAPDVLAPSAYREPVSYTHLTLPTILLV